MKNKKINSISIILTAIIFAFGCQAFSPRDVDYQGGSTRTVPSFNELNLSISAHVYLQQGNEQKVEIQASERLLEQIETEVRGNALNIKWTNKFWNNTYGEKIKIYITMTQVNALRVAGSGDISASGRIETQDIELKVSGSGDIILADLKADKIASHISGSADISIQGNNQASELEVSISGSGDVKADGIPAKNVDISISGSGDCRVNVQESLKARVSGSGDIYYKGNAMIDGKVSGSGSIKHL